MSEAEQRESMEFDVLVVGGGPSYAGIWVTP